MKKLFSSLFLKYLAIFIGILFATNVIATIFAFLFGFYAMPHTEVFPSMDDIPLMFSLRTGIVSIIIGAVFIFIASRTVTKPIKELSDAAKKVANGDFCVRVNIKKWGRDEVSELADNFNIMVNELSRNEYLHKDFVSNVSHEFKTPISAIRGYAEMLGGTHLSDEKRIEYANIIIANSSRLAKLSSDLLRLSELENGGIILKKDSFNLDEQIRDATLLLQSEWERKNIRIELDLDEVKFIGNKALMYQVWVNLISNAIKYNNEYGNVKITLKREEKLVICISDNGIGMTPKQQARIFESFYMADESRNSAGTGLGLPITKRIVELHGGKIFVHSVSQKGSDFTVIF